MIFRLCAIILAAFFLVGCQTVGSSVAGSCKVFERPPYAVLGKTAYDQNVADNFIESGVAGCNWKRPAARPASLDAAPGRKAMPVPVKRRSFIKRIRDRILPPKPESAPAVVAPAAEKPYVCTPRQAEAGECLPLVQPTPEPAVPPPAPRRPIDELLRPSR